MIAHLRDLPFVRGVDDAEGRLRVHTPDGSWDLHVVRRDGVPGAETARRLALRDEPVLLRCPTITSGVAGALRKAGVNYLDDAGNAYLNLGDRYVAWISGRRPVRSSAERPLRTAGLRVLGAALVDPLLFNRSSRDIAEEVGCGHSTVAAVRKLLAGEGSLPITSGSGPVVLRSEALLQRWARGYWDLLRPKLLLGRFASPGSVDALASALDAHLEGWAWGGSQAAVRLVHAGASDLVVHTADPSPRIPLIPDVDGAVEVLAPPFPSALADGERAHPLLVYGELRFRGDDRSLEVAAAVGDHLLEAWGV